MPLKDRELAIFREHLAGTVGSLHPCPACGRIQWEAASLSELPEIPQGLRDLANRPGAKDDLLVAFLRRRGGGRLTNTSIPLVVMTCGNCCYTMQFDWEKILEKRGRR